MRFPRYGLFPYASLPDLHDATRTAERAQAKAETAEQRLDRALLTMEAMWTLLRDRLQVTDEQLAQRIGELDESDGILDGRARRPLKSCPHCQKTIPGRFPRCLYCGEPVPVDPFA